MAPAIAAAALGLALAGCAGPGTATSRGAAAPATPAAPAAAERVLVGRSVQGRPIEAVALGRGAATLLVLATMHGDEAAGTPVAERLAARLASEPWRLLGRRVVIVPEVNPDGRRAGTRGNVACVDLNRDFPAPSRPERLGAGQPETDAIVGLVRRERPDLVVSIHQPLACVDWDGPAPAADVAARMARVSGLPARKLGARPGSLGSWAGGTLGIPVITVELPPGAVAGDAAGTAANERWDEAMAVAVHAVAAAAARRGGAIAPAQSTAAADGRDGD